MTLRLPSYITDVKQGGDHKRHPGTFITDEVIYGFFTVDHQWTVKSWNKAAEKLLGAQTGDIIGKNLWEKLAGVLPIDFYAVYHKVFLKDIPAHVEKYWGKMGAWFDVVTFHSKDSLSVSFKSSSHSARSVHSTGPNQQLKALNELYRFVTEITNDCLWEWDLQAQRFFWIDGGHKRIFGYPIENSIVPQSFWEDLLHPDDKVRLLTNLHKIIMEETDSNWETEYRFKKADGEYAYVHDRGHIIYGADGRAFRMIGATQDITARKSAEHQLAQERLSQQREITGAVLTAQENERADIGKELHDNLNQLLGAAKLYIGMARADGENAAAFLDKAVGYIVNVISEIRKISKQLAVPGVHDMHLVDSIRILIDDLAQIHTVKIEFYVEGIDKEEMSEKLQLTIFRIVQEQLNNILKHSKATQAVVRLTNLGNEVCLLITDNGVGWDMLKKKEGVGIINIKSRAQLYHGKVTITSKPGEGFSLEVSLPNELQSIH